MQAYRCAFPRLVCLYKAGEIGRAAERFKRGSIMFLFGVKYIKQLKLKKALPQYRAGVADVIAQDAMTSSFFPSQPCPLQTSEMGRGGGLKSAEWEREKCLFNRFS